MRAKVSKRAAHWDSKSLIVPCILAEKNANDISSGKHETFVGSHFCTHVNKEPPADFHGFNGPSSVPGARGNKKQVISKAPRFDPELFDMHYPDPCD